MGPLALVGAGLARLADFVVPGKSAVAIESLRGAFLVMLGISSWQRSAVYENSETLWADTLAKNPDCGVANENLGMVFWIKDERMKLHGRTFEAGLKADPDHAEAKASTWSKRAAAKGQGR